MKRTAIPNAWTINRSIIQQLRITKIIQKQKPYPCSLLMTNQLYRFIQSQTYLKFDQQFRQKYKKQYHSSDIYTVICSIWIVNKSYSQSGNFNQSCKFVCLANGTKTLPYSVYCQNKGFLLKDMHAEILVIKAFRKFIINQITAQQSVYFTKDLNKNKFSFNDNNYDIVLFSTQPFCGDCSINQSSNFFTGSKPLKHFDSQKLPNQKFQKHILRTKPGRTDLPQHKKSLTLSCSDKLALYNILGIQGKELFHRVRPVYVTCFVVETDGANKRIIQQGLDFVYRLARLTNPDKQQRNHDKQLKSQDKQLKSQDKQQISRKLFKIKIQQKQRKISNQFKNNQPVIICLQKAAHQQANLIEADNNLKKKQKQGFQVSLIYTPTTTQWLNSKTGLPQGCSLTNYMKQKKVSKFSKYAFQNEFLEVFGGDQNSKTEGKQGQLNLIQQTFKYSATKDRVKLLFGIWTDQFKITHTSSQILTNH